MSWSGGWRAGWARTPPTCRRSASSSSTDRWGVAELARRLGIRTASATVLVDRLERAGHVERVRDTADRRRVVLTETAAARAASYAAWSPVIREIDEVCRALSEDEKEFARDLLARLRAAVERSGRDDAPGPLDSAR